MLFAAGFAAVRTLRAAGLLVVDPAWLRPVTEPEPWPRCAGALEPWLATWLAPCFGRLFSAGRRATTLLVLECAGLCSRAAGRLTLSAAGAGCFSGSMCVLFSADAASEK